MSGASTTFHRGSREIPPLMIDEEAYVSNSIYSRNSKTSLRPHNPLYNNGCHILVALANNALPLLLGVHRWSVESWIHLCWTYLCAACRIPLPRTCHKDTEFVDNGDCRAQVPRDFATLLQVVP